MGFERHHSALIVASAITVASFVGATAYSQNSLARLDELSSAIETNAVPSIEYLSQAAVRLTRLSQYLDDMSSAGEQRDSALAAAPQELAALEHEISAYSRLTPLPGESDISGPLRDDVRQATELFRSAMDLQRRGTDTPAAVDVRARTDDALTRAVRSVLATLEFDVRQSEAMARDVRNMRMETLRIIVGLDAAATMIALVAVFIAYRASRRHDELLHERASLLSVRVTELDRFAGRVAHDVLSPLGTIAAALPLLEQSCDARGRTYVDRSRRALQRVQQLVDGLLMFARSGARPDPSSSSSLDAVLSSVVADCSETAAERRIDLMLENASTARVPCSPGVLTSIVQNLVRNALNYMGDASLRRIALRTKIAGPIVRLEIEDTGPGIPIELQPTIFDPFVRGSHEQAGGTGLGLATVKRLVESHHGTVGVESKPGAGSLFWVELPVLRAPVDASPAMASQH